MADETGTGGTERRDLVDAVDRLWAWTATLPTDGSPRREVASAVLDVLDHRLRGEDSLPPAELVITLVHLEPDVLRLIDEVAATASTLQERLTDEVVVEVAAPAVRILNEFVNEVQRHLTDRALRNLRTDAFTDVLTRAGNRRAFERDVHRAVQTARRHERSLAIAILDLDGLKRLNDTRGHPAGDEALRNLAGAFLRELRGGDGFYRIGGDEFTLLLPESGGEAVDALVARARHAAPAFSYGWAAFPDDGDTPSALLGCADARLLESRQARQSPAAAGPAARPRSTGVRAAATAVPVLLALVVAELVRRAAGVDLGHTLMQSWVGMLAVGGVLGPVVAWRWCTGHRRVLDSALCGARVGVVVLILLVAALVPVNQIRDELRTAALRRQQQQLASGPPTRPRTTPSPDAVTPLPQPLPQPEPAPLAVTTPTQAAAPALARALPEPATVKTITPPTPVPATLTAAPTTTRRPTVGTTTTSTTTTTTTTTPASSDNAHGKGKGKAKGHSEHDHEPPGQSSGRFT